jgi:BolA protein
MQINNFLKEIENKIRNHIDLESINIIDNSDKHKTHKFFDKTKYHLKVEIQSIFLKSLNRVKAHKEVLKAVNEDSKTKFTL